MSESMIEVRGLSKKFCHNLKRSLWYGVKDIGSELIGSKKERNTLRKDEFWALKDVDFDIKRGELFGLIGPNGAGKTTLLKLLSGIIKPDQGEIIVRGKLQALIALGAGFNPILTGRENIYVNGAVLGFSKTEMDQLIEEIQDFSEIGDFLDMPVRSYSSGMHVRLGFSVAVNLRPDILLVDEVLAVGDAAFKRKARNKMMELLHSGISVLFVSHSLALITSLTSQCMYLKRGLVEAIGPSETVTSQYLNDSLIEYKATESTPEYYMTSAYLTTPEFIVENVLFFDDTGNICNEFSSFDDLKIRFEFRCKKPMENISFALSIRDQVNDVIISSSKLSNLKQSLSGSVAIECTIIRNNLREGWYHLGFYAADLYGPLYKSHSVSSFKILGDMATIEKSVSSLGYVIMDTQWHTE
ncbi:ABC transporter ATP-binding protein [candidate division CSSED10-310 bacterium]|uniref:ABC transporter ATP-binding protein n=1 Tax=candidate division CSSED10-310 bacterium TaxID=2855610 RepID=A0ABV6YYR4_UNCC1